MPAMAMPACQHSSGTCSQLRNTKLPHAEVPALLGQAEADLILWASLLQVLQELVLAPALTDDAAMALVQHSTGILQRIHNVTALHYAREHVAAVELEAVYAVVAHPPHGLHEDVPVWLAWKQIGRVSTLVSCTTTYDALPRHVRWKAACNAG